MSAGDGPPSRNWEPPRLTTALVALVAVAAVAVLAAAADLLAPAAVGVVGAASFAGALWAVGRERYRVVGALVGSVLFVPVGLCLAGALAATVLVQYATAFPAPTPADIVTPTLRIAATTALVGCGFLAVLGACAQGRPLETGNVRRSVGVTGKLAAVPLAVGLGGAALAVLASPEVQPTFDPFTLVAAGLDAAATVLLSPPDPVAATEGVGRLAGEVALATFALVATLAVAAARSIVRSLPITELAAGPETERLRATVDRVERLLGQVLLGAVFALFPLVAVADIALSRRALADLAGPATTDLAYAAALSGPLRALAVGLVALAVVVRLVVAGLRRVVRGRSGEAFLPAVPWLVGLGAVPVASAVAGPALDAAIPAVATRLSGFEDVFTELATGVVAFYGPGIVATLLVGVAFVATATVATGVYFLLRTGLLASATAGSTLAGAGVVGAAAFGAAVDLPLALVVGATGAGLAVADLGRHARTLGREVGRAGTTYPVELVRGGAAAVVAVLAAGAALAASRVALGGVVTALPAAMPLTLTLGCAGTLVLLLWAR
ncbi:hypothetical protein [Halosegnis marinus]|uniref:Uncharacterized protein n=1 Tax=Halosegnis marinus TaxID=3034023 RepID=A0ABD5ZMK5_9EURY|nr:hypothetical protein [Halosegnis sp. DT85]